MTSIHVKNQKVVLARLTEEVNKIKSDTSYVAGSMIEIPIETIDLIAKELNVSESDVLITLGEFLNS